MLWIKFRHNFASGSSEWKYKCYSSIKNKKDFNNNDYQQELMEMRQHV